MTAEQEKDKQILMNSISARIEKSPAATKILKTIPPERREKFLENLADDLALT